jgi:excisionase family DNA binding protein
MLLTTQQVADKLNLSRVRITQLIHEQVIPATKYGGAYLVEEKDLDNLVWNRKPGPQK